jgi:hypothetical protein
MNPKTPTSAMSQGGTFMRPGAMAWGQGDPRSQAPASPSTPAAIEHALAAAVKDPDQVTELLDELSRGRLWLPLPDARPVTDGSAVMLPTVTYLGAEFVPAFTSAERLASWVGRAGTSPAPAPSQGEADRVLPGDDPFGAMPHIVVPAADLARRMPAGVGIALNPGAEASVPIYPEGVGYLAATMVVADGTQVRVGRPPADPVTLLSEVRTALSSLPGVQQASRAWLSVPGQGEGLVIAVTLDDPASETAHRQVLDAIEQAVHAVPEPGFPIDVTFPGEGEGEPDQVDAWICAYAEPFYIRL